MRHLKPIFSFVIFLAFSACQRVWHPAPQLQPGTSMPVSAAITNDAKAEETIAPYRARLGQEMNEVIGKAPAALDKAEVESALGNFATDLMRSQAATAQKKQIDLGLTTNGSLRTSIPQGDVTVGHIFELMPFENELVVITLPGTTIQKLFDFAAANARAKQVTNLAGATYTIRNGKPENIKINGQPLNPNQIYTIATSDYLANGGDNMTFFSEALNIELTGITVRNAIINHIRQLTATGIPIEANVDGRVNYIK